MCQTRILSTKGSSVISHCIGCKLMYIWHNNLLLSFSPEEFDSFKRLTQNLDFKKNCFAFPDQVDRVTLRTPNPDIGFAFTEEELRDFNMALNEAVFMQEIYSMMKE